MKDDKKKKEAENLIKKGDRLFEKGRYKDAHTKYKEASQLCPEMPDVYDKLSAAHEKIVKDWGIGEMVESVGYAMAKQEAESPSIRFLHRRLSPEWNTIMNKINELILCEGEEAEFKIVEEIETFGTAAIYPLIHILLEIKKTGKEK